MKRKGETEVVNEFRRRRKENENVNKRNVEEEWRAE